MGFRGKYIFIGCNPYKYIDKYDKSKNPFFHDRMDALTLLIHKHIKRVESEENNGLVEVHHLLYDKN